VPTVTSTPQLPNPASKYCVEQGYNISIRTDPNGSQAGYCIFPDGKECEEWAYYRGECTL
jgi:inhibitor of cysteine peptidase